MQQVLPACCYLCCLLATDGLTHVCDAALPLQPCVAGIAIITEFKFRTMDVSTDVTQLSALVNGSFALQVCTLRVRCACCAHPRSQQAALRALFRLECGRLSCLINLQIPRERAVEITNWWQTWHTQLSNKFTTRVRAALPPLIGAARQLKAWGLT